MKRNRFKQCNSLSFNLSRTTNGYTLGYQSIQMNSNYERLRGIKRKRYQTKGKCIIRKYEEKERKTKSNQKTF